MVALGSVDGFAAGASTGGGCLPIKISLDKGFGDMALSFELMNIVYITLVGRIFCKSSNE